MVDNVVLLPVPMTLHLRLQFDDDDNVVYAVADDYERICQSFDYADGGIGDVVHLVVCFVIVLEHLDCWIVQLRLDFHYILC